MFIYGEKKTAELNLDMSIWMTAKFMGAFVDADGVQCVLRGFFLFLLMSEYAYVCIN